MVGDLSDGENAERRLVRVSPWAEANVWIRVNGSGFLGLVKCGVLDVGLINRLGIMCSLRLHSNRVN